MGVNLRSFTLLLMTILASVGCSEFMEESIDDKRVVLFSPGKNAELESYTVDFVWDELAYALHYQLQVACPSFDSVVYFSLDTLVIPNHFTLTLPPGRFEWRVRALNGSSKTAYAKGGFLIHNTDLDKQRIVLTAPADDAILSANFLNFTWQPMHGASSYTVQIDTNHFIDEENILFSKELSEPMLNYSSLEEKKFQWRVKASDGEVETIWSVVREFQVDRTAPEAPVLLVPDDNEQVAQPVVLKWEAQDDVETYQLYLYERDSVTMYKKNYPLSLTTNSYTFNEGKKGERLVWRIRAVDRAGNRSDFSAYRVFNLTN